MYKVLDNIELNEGIVILSDDQAKTRTHNLNSLGNGLYEIIKCVTFKKGEIIGFSGNIDRIISSKIEIIEEIKFDNSISDIEELIVEEIEIPEITEWPRSIGKGWFELPNGKRIRGREAAIGAMNGLQ